MSNIHARVILNLKLQLGLGLKAGCSAFQCRLQCTSVFS